MSLSLIVYNGVTIPYALLMMDGLLLCELCDWLYDQIDTNIKYTHSYRFGTARFENRQINALKVQKTTFNIQRWDSVIGCWEIKQVES